MSMKSVDISFFAVLLPNQFEKPIAARRLPRDYVKNQFIYF